MASHPYGVRPLGNAMFATEPPAKLAMRTLFRVEDEHLLTVLEFCGLRELCSLSECCQFLYAFVHHPDLWKDRAIESISSPSCSAAAAPPAPLQFNGSWKAALVSHITGKPFTHTPVRVRNVYSDVLSTPWRVYSARVPPVWRRAPNLLTTNVADMSIRQFVAHHEAPRQPILITGISVAQLLGDAATAVAKAFSPGVLAAIAAIPTPTPHADVSAPVPPPRAPTDPVVWGRLLQLEAAAAVAMGAPVPNFTCGPLRMPFAAYCAYAAAQTDERPTYLFDRHYRDASPAIAAVIDRLIGPAAPPAGFGPDAFARPPTPDACVAATDDRSSTTTPQGAAAGSGGDSPTIPDATARPAPRAGVPLLPMFDERRNLFAAATDTLRPSNSWAIVGPTDSGSTWHVDPNATSAWNVVLTGRKIWVLWDSDAADADAACAPVQRARARAVASSDVAVGTPPPGVVASEDGAEVATTVSAKEWFMLHTDVAKSGVAARRCVADPGTAVFVPSGWWHTVINEDPSRAAVPADPLPPVADVTAAAVLHYVLRGDALPGDDLYRPLTFAVTGNFAAPSTAGRVFRFLREKSDQVSACPQGSTPAALDAAVAAAIHALPPHAAEVVGVEIEMLQRQTEPHAGTEDAEDAGGPPAKRARVEPDEPFVFSFDD